MLTGDKLETAENIGYSCRLIQSHFKTMFIKADDGLRERYSDCLRMIEECKEKGQPKTLLIEGNALSKKTQRTTKKS